MSVWIFPPTKLDLALAEDPVAEAASRAILAAAQADEAAIAADRGGDMLRIDESCAGRAIDADRPQMSKAAS